MQSEKRHSNDPQGDMQDTGLIHGDHSTTGWLIKREQNVFVK